MPPSILHVDGQDWPSAWAWPFEWMEYLVPPGVARPAGSNPHQRPPCPGDRQLLLDDFHSGFPLQYGRPVRLRTHPPGELVTRWIPMRVGFYNHAHRLEKHFWRRTLWAGKNFNIDHRCLSWLKRRELVPLRQLDQQQADRYQHHQCRRKRMPQPQPGCLE